MIGCLRSLRLYSSFITSRLCLFRFPSPSGAWNRHTSDGVCVWRGACTMSRDQARGRLGRYGRPGGRNFALNGTQGEVGVSLKKKKKKKKNFFFFFFFLERLIFILSPHKCKLWWHYQTIYYHCIVFLLPLNGNSMCNCWFASKLTENVVVLRYNFSLCDCHFSLIVLQGEVISP